MGLVCGLFGVVWGGLGWVGSYRFASCLFNRYSLGFLHIGLVYGFFTGGLGCPRLW